MNKKTKTILIITVIALLLIFGGITYAYFTSNITDAESASTIIVTGGRLEIRYDNLSNTITMENIYPRQNAWVVKNFTVTGTNTTDLTMNYKVGLEVVSNTFSADELSAKLENSNTAQEKEALDGTPISETTKRVPASNTVWFGSGQFETTDPTEVHKYTLSIYYPESNANQNTNQQKAFTGKVVIVEDGTGELAQSGKACIIEDTPQTITSYDINYTACTNYYWNNYGYGSDYPASKQGLDSYEQDDYDYVDETCKNKETFESEIGGSDNLPEALENGLIENVVYESIPPAQGDSYTDGQYNYEYYEEGSLANESPAGWKVFLIDPISTEPVTTELCTTINGKPIVSMEDLFYSSQATSLDLSSFDTSNVIYMSNMFYQSAAETIIFPDVWTTGENADMSNMFTESHATSLDLSGFDTSNVTNMSYMFYGSPATIIFPDVWTTGENANMTAMFSDSTATSLDLSGFDTSNVTNMSYMFYNSQATSLDLSSFNTSNVTNTEGMLNYIQATSLDLSSLTTNQIINSNIINQNNESRTIYVTQEVLNGLINAGYTSEDLKGFVVKS